MAVIVELPEIIVEQYKTYRDGAHIFTGQCGVKV
jgi:hypothetical protein